MLQKWIQTVSGLWVLASWMADEAPSKNVSRKWVCSGIFCQAGWLIRLLLKMCPECECVLASSGKLDGWRGSLSKCVQRVSVFWHLLPSWMVDETPFENVSRKWVCSWQAEWLIRPLLKMCPGSECVLACSGKWMADEAPENVSREWVCSGMFWQAEWLMRLPLKMCPGSECVLASLPSWMIDGAPSDVCPGSECVLASFGKLNGWWGSIWKCVQRVSMFWSSSKLHG